ncbi:hypothetical protein ff3pr_00440 [Weissella cibaria]|uniref:Uncharacterized protein n=1 Tax=Weissella cibaria TaxID=137591 RepID=A0A0D1M3P0_9LACO|nr:hypothetical protein QX99_00230 [Weissella cibaria]KIU24045.1 hypothetical protein ff3pr_00440 [Weissella cibaria]
MGLVVRQLQNIIQKIITISKLLIDNLTINDVKIVGVEEK